MKANPGSEVIYYFEMDPNINLMNYKKAAISAPYDKEMLCQFLGSEKYFDKFKKYFENVDTTPNYKKKLEYFSSLWVEKVFHSEILRIQQDFSLNVQPGTLCLMVLFIKYEFEQLKLWRESTERKNFHTPQEQRILDVSTFIEFMHEYMKEPSDKLVIEIFYKNQMKNKFVGDALLREIYKWYCNYFEGTDIDRMQEWLMLGWEFGQLKSKLNTTDNYSSSYSSNYKYLIVKRLNEWLMTMNIELSVRINIIRRLFLTKNILELQSSSTKDQYDRIYQILRRPPTSIPS